jgi:hypothetical protein
MASSFAGIVPFEATLNTCLTDPYLPNELVEANTRAHKNGAFTWHLINTARGAARPATGTPS